MSVPENASPAVFVRTSSHDLDHYRAQPGNWNVQAEQLSRGTFYSQIRSLQFQDLIVYDNRWGAATLIRGESPAGWVMFGGIIRPRRSQVSWCGQVASDQVYACTPERQAIEFSLESGAHDIVILVKSDLLTQVAGDTALDRVLRAGLIDFRHRGPQLLQIVMGHLLRLEQSPELICHQVIAADIRAEILAFLELCFKPMSTAEEWTLPKNRRQEAIHLALSQVWQSAGNTSALDMARSAEVSQRTLEFAFKDFMGLTPGQYLKLFRLNESHRILAQSDSGSTSVTEVIQSLGFTHPGRFSGDYKQLFGELPSDTLDI